MAQGVALPWEAVVAWEWAEEYWRTVEANVVGRVARKVERVTEALKAAEIIVR